MQKHLSERHYAFFFDGACFSGEVVVSYNVKDQVGNLHFSDSSVELDTIFNFSKQSYKSFEDKFEKNFNVSLLQQKKLTNFFFIDNPRKRKITSTGVEGNNFKRIKPQ